MAKVARTGLRFIDRFILFTAWVVTCGLVYGLGFYTGKGTQERRLGMEERIVRLPVTAEVPPEGQRPKATSEFTFYETLVAGDRARETTGGRATVPEATPPTTIATPPSRVAAAPVPAGTAPAAGAAHAGGTAAAPGAAHATGTASAPAAGAAPPPAGDAKPAAVATAPKPAATGAPKPVVAEAAAPKPPPAFPAAVPPAPKPIPAVPVSTPPAAAPAPPRKAGWTVEASPSRDRAEVETLLAGLKSRGYDARVVSVRRDGDTWYRLRVGRYATSAEASEVMRRLREREGVSHAFVASE